MGIIIKQSIKGSIWSYLGVAVGFVTTAYLFPNYLTTDTIGLFGLLVAWSALLAQFSSLGFNGVTSRLFPYFRDKDKGHNGYLFIAFVVMLVGFGLFLMAYFVFSPWLAENNIEKSKLFSEYIWLLIPLTFFTLLFTVLDTFNRLLYNAVFGTFLIEFVQRILILSVMLLYVAGLINIHQLILAYAGAVSAKAVIIFFYLAGKGEVSLRPQLNFIDKRLRREMGSVAFFSILTGVGGNLVFNIDKIIINEMMGLSATGIYTIAFFFGTLVIIPSRPMLRISGTLIAEAWKKNDVDYIDDIYKRSCLNQFIIGAFLFGGIWVNIDNILIILGPEYADGKWVIFFIALGYLIDMATGANSRIIAFSKYYRMALWFLLILIVLVVSTMYLLIPVRGITGAAVAIALSFLANNLMRFIFLYLKFRFQPFNYRFLLVIVAFMAAYFLGFVMPDLLLIWDILVKGGVFAVVYLLMITGLKVSADVNNTLVTVAGQAKKWINRK
jgi:O-antigen/teichoic acid export membrane protein